MWYVNKMNKIVNMCKVLSFILTMWYVNLAVKPLWVDLQEGFYINYVVCKYELQEKSEVNSINVLY